MCGLAGILQFARPSTQKAADRIERMLGSMPWRGPNAKGTWQDGHCALGHLRLSIIDLSEAANQPMTDSLGRTIVFNGEIYNYIELREQLRKGYHFKTQSDTEVILAAYNAWGTDCVRHFNGDWAFALFDPETRQLFLSRDRFGIKPLYYYRKGTELMFASEVRALLAGGVPARVRKVRLAEFLRYRRNETYHDTLYEDIKPIRPGTSLLVEPEGGVSEKVHYDQNDLFRADVPRTLDNAIDAFASLFRNAVRVRMRADVPVGVCLSGGLDSSAITAVARLNDAQQVNTYSAVFPGSEADEEPFSTLVAEHCNTKHHQIAPTLDDFFEYFHHYMLAQDTPHASPRALARYLVLKRAGENVTVLLDGQGGDEIFGGYGATYKIYRREYQERFGKKLLMRPPTKASYESRVPRLEEFLPILRDAASQVGRQIDVLDPPRDAYTNRQYAILRNNMLSLLHTEDRMTMIHSLEGRVPLLDHRLVEFCFSAPVEFKMQEYDKYILRAWLSRDHLLPRRIVRRTDKKGFPTSYDTLLYRDPRAHAWFRDRLKTLMREVPSIFCPKAVEALEEEQRREGVNNANRLLAIISVLLCFKRNYVSVID